MPRLGWAGSYAEFRGSSQPARWAQASPERRPGGGRRGPPPAAARPGTPGAPQAPGSRCSGGQGAAAKGGASSPGEEARGCRRAAAAQSDSPWRTPGCCRPALGGAAPSASGISR